MTHFTVQTHKELHVCSCGSVKLHHDRANKRLEKSGNIRSEL